MSVLEGYLTRVSSLEKSASKKMGLQKLVKGIRSGLIDQPGPRYTNYLNKRMESLLNGRVRAVNISNARREAGGFLPNTPRKYVHKRPRSEKAIALQEAMMENPNMGGLKSSLAKWDKNYPTNIRGRPPHVVQRELRDKLKSKHFPLERRPGDPRTDQGRTNIKTTKSDILRDRINREHYSPKPRVPKAPKATPEGSVGKPVSAPARGGALRGLWRDTKKLPSNIKSFIRPQANDPRSRLRISRDIHRGTIIPGGGASGGALLLKKRK